ncbi:MAG: NAD(P)H-hydrate dehydratase [Chloroflexi bacterium]|nr:NAD(P)H-hydrate dehydratase [Chloroflexota bacterium]
MALSKLPRRAPDTHKGDYGRILIVAGSTGMCGAAALASDGAYRSGAGLVYLACPATLVPILSVKQTCAVVRPLPDTGEGFLSADASLAITGLAAGCSAVAIGPGLGLHPKTQEAVRQAVTAATLPLVIDADGLNAFAQTPELLAKGRVPRVLTPHRGELARLTPGAVRKDRESWAGEAASRFHSVVVLKGHQTIVADGSRSFVNKTGNPGMATGGSGDVLTGMIAALIGQGMSPYEAACLAVHLHGLAGDLAAKRCGQMSMMATDILDALPEAFKKGA